MPRIALVLVAGVAAVTAAVGGGVLDPHMDSSLVPGGCNACHQGHGASRSPMLPKPQAEVCLSCHESDAARNKAVLQGVLSEKARPQALSSALAQPYVHPLDENAFSRYEADVVTCTSCHSPHRGMARAKVEAAVSRTPSRSPRSPIRAEFELCQDCHGRGAGLKREPDEVGGRLDPRSRSYHPVKAPVRERAPSLRSELSDKAIGCTDCHGNSAPDGAQGPHGSSVRSLLKAEYVAVDGIEESEKSYALCYQCHEREKVLDSQHFPEHRRHVVDLKASCATCHDAHGSIENRALVRIGERGAGTLVGPSASTGELAFVSSSPGSGSCYVTCHGYDHGPGVYGGPQIDNRAVRDHLRSRRRPATRTGDGEGRRRTGREPQ